jgi:hypothetical protein
VFGCVLLAFLALQVPQLVFEAPGELDKVRTRLEAIDPQRLADIAELTGGGGGSVRVLLAPESSELARQVPQWIVGFAAAEPEHIVLFPSRTPVYPNSSLEDVLRHEVAHVLIRRSAKGGFVPRWFNEGLAMNAERGWLFEDRTRLVSLLATGIPTESIEIDRFFLGGPTEQSRAYTLSGALVRDLLLQFGQDAPRRILDAVGAGKSFDAAFSDVTSLSPSDARRQFWSRRGFWMRWLPILFAQETLWLGLTLLVLLAVLKRRRRNAEIEKRWAEEDGRNPFDDDL